MKNIFPEDIIKYTNEFYWSSRNVKSKIIYITIIVTILIVFILLPFIKINTSAQSLGIIRTTNENNLLQSVISAKIDRIEIKENAFVEEGDTIIYLNTDPIEEQINGLNNKLDENQSFINDLENMLANNMNIKTSKYISEYSSYLSKINEQKVNLDRYEYEYTISKNIYERGVESKFEFNQNEKNYQSAKAQLNSTKTNIINTWYAEKSRLETENEDIKSQINKLLKDKIQYYIIAPITGFIIKYNGLKSGNYLMSGQSIGEIASNGNLLVETYVSPSDISYISVDQKVNMQVDAFDYRQWGLLDGSVIEIGSDIISLDNKPYFKVLCKIDRDYMKLKNGYIGHLKKGMTLTCRFELTERSIAQLLFDKVDNWINPKIINETN